MESDQALESAFRRLPFAVVVLDSELSLRPFNKKASELFEREGLTPALLSTRPSHPLAAFVRRLLDAPGEPHSEVLEFPSRARYVVDPSDLSSKGRDRWLVLLIAPAESAADPEGVNLSEWGFTPREAEVMRLLLAGTSSKTITQRLKIAQNTLRTHVKRLFAKAGARTRTELMAKVLKGKK